MLKGKKQKIALVVDSFLPNLGGIELHVRDLALELQKQGSEAHVITTTPADIQTSRPINTGTSRHREIQTIPIHRLNVSLLPFWRITWDRKLVPLLRNLLIKERFDLLHSHSSVVSPLAYSAIFLANQLKIPNVLTNHSLLEKSIYTFRLLECFYGWRSWSTVLTSISEAAAEGLRKASKRREILILPNGIHLNEWRIPKTQNFPLQITSVMRLHRKKRGRMLVRTISKIEKKLGSKIPFQLNLIGDGEERSRLEKKVRKLGLQEKIKFLGFCPREEIKKIFSQTDFFVLPTLKEALSIATLEAKAAGLPTVAMNYGGVKEIIQHGENGFLAENDAEFADYILKLLQNESLRKRMSENSQKGLDRFDWSQVIQKHGEVYEEATSKVR